MPSNNKQKNRPREIGLVDSVSDALIRVQKLSDESDTFSCYRGHGSISWTATPSIFRQSQRILSSEYTIVRDLVSRYPDHFLHDNTMFDRLVRMQHFGLPTRLMDVTSNPLVGLYFAVTECENEDGSLIIYRISADRKKYYDSDSVSCVCNLANLKMSEKEILENTTASNISDFHKLHPTDRLLQFIREEKPHFQARIKKDDLFRPYYVVAKQNNARIIAQSGAFLAFGLKLEDSSAFSKEISSYSIRIPKNAKKKIRNELRAIGIDAGTLFPEIDRAAAQIVENYK
ncbi:FRG domain-containing protein [Parasphingorhabdus marina DSM 22363]|uniref:FRG domain-containing protein n=1 Tax=Parasphingorhabdus marina DSM 22363 TaxID=1123272 RepID=A0A1N6HPE2_9SPHN|nr:FRG domain-containing protein [Parasphingorhabdus marina]SIO21684.1 FRG domain-containing protein [Parasphingorhabdus marina DSM 22363]